MLDSQEFLENLHHALLEVPPSHSQRTHPYHLQISVDEGFLVCPESNYHFPINNGIPNMLISDQSNGQTP